MEELDFVSFVNEYISSLIEDDIREKINNRADMTSTKIDRLLNGGKGSGNFGHSGRKGEVGGSSKSGSPSGSLKVSYGVDVVDSKNQEFDNREFADIEDKILGKVREEIKARLADEGTLDGLSEREVESEIETELSIYEDEDYPSNDFLNTLLAQERGWNKKGATKLDAVDFEKAEGDVYYRGVKADSEEQLDEYMKSPKLASGAGGAGLYMSSESDIAKSYIADGGFLVKIKVGKSKEDFGNWSDDLEYAQKKYKDSKLEVSEGGYRQNDMWDASIVRGNDVISYEQTGKNFCVKNKDIVKYTVLSRENFDNSVKSSKELEQTGLVEDIRGCRFGKKKVESNTLDVLLGEISDILGEAYVLNGGKGSGNFGHSGRIGKVGGSGKSDGRISDNYETPDKWDDVSSRSYSQQELVKIYRRLRNVERFDEFFASRMKDAGFSDDDIKKYRDKLAEKEQELKSGKKAKTGVSEGSLSRKEQTKSVAESEKNEKVKLISEVIQYFSDNINHKGKTREQEQKYLEKYADKEVLTELKNNLSRMKEEYSISSGIYFYHFGGKSLFGQSIYNTYSRGNPDFGFGLNGGYLKKESYFEDEEEKSFKTKWHTSEDYFGTIRHELGHIASYERMRDLGIAMSSLQSGQFFKMVVDRARYEVAGLDVPKSAKEAVRTYSKVMGASRRGEVETLNKKEKTVLDMYLNTDKKYMSKYGHSKYSEAIAESIANPSYSKLTKTIDRIIKNKEITLDEFIEWRGGMVEMNDGSIKKVNSANKKNQYIEICTGYGPESSKDMADEVSRKVNELLSE